MNLTPTKEHTSKDLNFCFREYKSDDFIIKVEEDLTGSIPKNIEASDGLYVSIHITKGNTAFCELQDTCRKEEDFDRLNDRIKKSKELFFYLKERFDTI